MARLNQPRLVIFACALACGVSGCSLCAKKKELLHQQFAVRGISNEGISAMESGDFARAQELFTEAVATSPTDIDARRNLAETLWQQGTYRDAAVQMEAAVRLDSRHAPTVIRSGEMLLAVGAVDRAMQRAEQAIRLDANLAGGWALRGRLYRQRGELDRALADLQHSLRFAPNNSSALLEVAQIQLELGKPQRSLSTLHCLLDTYPAGQEPQQALWLEGLAYSSLDRHQEAAQSLYAASQRGLPSPDLLYQLAQAEQSAGLRDAATKSLRRALAIDDSHEPSRVMLVRLEQAESVDSEPMILR